MFSRNILVAMALLSLSTGWPQAASATEVAVTQAELERLEIKLQEVGPATDEAIAVLPATVIPPLNSRIAVPAPFAGTVVSVEVLPGEAVQEGKPLMTIASRELVETLSGRPRPNAGLDDASGLLCDKRITGVGIGFDVAERYEPAMLLDDRALAITLGLGLCRARWRADGLIGKSAGSGQAEAACSRLRRPLALLGRADEGA